MCVELIFNVLTLLSRTYARDRAYKYSIFSWNYKIASLSPPWGVEKDTREGMGRGEVSVSVVEAPNKNKKCSKSRFGIIKRGGGELKLNIAQCDKMNINHKLQ